MTVIRHIHKRKRWKERKTHEPNKNDQISQNIFKENLRRPKNQIKFYYFYIFKRNCNIFSEFVIYFLKCRFSLYWVPYDQIPIC